MEENTLERQGSAVSEGKGSVAPGKITKRDSYLKSPPYWQRHRSTTQSTVRSFERPPAISLQDNTEEPLELEDELWAKSITVDHHVIVKGANGIGAYVVWVCKVDIVDGPSVSIRKRYSQFEELRNKLLHAFPTSTATSLPPLPPKSSLYKFKPKFLAKRREGLSYFLDAVMLSPQYATSDIVKDFVFAAEEGESRTPLSWLWNM